MNALDELKRFQQRISELNEWARKHYGLADDEFPLSASTASEDWLLIVTIHALLETALNNAITKELSRPQLSAVTARLDTSNTACGKIAFAKSLGILTADECAVVQRLSEMRNKCVHDISNFRFSIDEYVEQLNASRRKELRGALRKMFVDKTDFPAMKPALLGAATSVLMHLMLHGLQCEHRNKIAALKTAIVDIFIQSNTKK